MKSNGPNTKRLGANPFHAVARDAVASPGEWQEIEIPGTVSAAPSQAHYAAAGTVFTISQRNNTLYIRYDGPEEKP